MNLWIESLILNVRREPDEFGVLFYPIGDNVRHFELLSEIGLAKRIGNIDPTIRHYKFILSELDSITEEGLEKCLHSELNHSLGWYLTSLINEIES